MDRFEDSFNKNGMKYRSDFVFCTPRIQGSVSNWLDFQQTINPGVNFTRVPAKDVKECLDFVYEGKADVTFYDEPILLTDMQNDFYSVGKCGFPGGFCSEEGIVDRDICLCPVKDGLGKCLPTSNSSNKWTEINGNLVTRGDTFSPFGCVSCPKQIVPSLTNASLCPDAHDRRASGGMCITRHRSPHSRA